KRDGLAIFISVVVGVAGKDVCVGATQTDSGNSNEHVMASHYRQRNVPHFDTFDAEQDAGAHGGGILRRRNPLLPGFNQRAQTVLSCRTLSSASISLTSKRPVSCNLANRRIVSAMPNSSGVDGKSPINLLIAASFNAGAIGIGGPLKLTRSRPEFSLITLAIRATSTVSPCRLKTCAPAGARSAQATKAAAVSLTYWKSVAPLNRM